MPDAEAAVAAVEQKGGQVIVPASPMGQAGTMAVAVDPAGAVIGLWQPGDFAGFELLGSDQGCLPHVRVAP